MSELSEPSNHSAMALLVRPCEEYKDEYRECRRWRSRFHQYFIAGQVQDCTGYSQQHRHCQLFTQSGDKQALEALVAIEMSRMKRRLQGYVNNPVWEDRAEPPADWSAPLPPMLQERAQASGFTAAAAAAGANEGAADQAGCDAETPVKTEASPPAAVLAGAADPLQDTEFTAKKSPSSRAQPSSFCNIS